MEPLNKIASHLNNQPAHCMQGTCRRTPAGLRLGPGFCIGEMDTSLFLGEMDLSAKSLILSHTFTSPQSGGASSTMIHVALVCVAGMLDNSGLNSL